MKTKFDGNQLDTIDVLIGNILNSRECGDDEDLCMYSKQLSSFLMAASARQHQRDREELDEAANEPETRWIVLESYGARKIAVIKTLRACVPDLGLRDAKVCAESAPIGLSREIPGVTDELVTSLKSAGAFVEVWHHKPPCTYEPTCDYFKWAAGLVEP